MPDQTPVTDDDRKAHEWADLYFSEDGILRDNAVARAIKAHVPAPPATLADELREWGVRPFDGLNWTRFHNLADRVENVVKEGREYASKADQWEVTAKRLASERDEARGGRDAINKALSAAATRTAEALCERDEARDNRDAHRDLANRLSAEMERMKDSHRITIQERDEWGEENGELRAEVELLAAQIDRLIAEMDKARNGDWLKEDLPAPADVPVNTFWLIEFEGKHYEARRIPWSFREHHWSFMRDGAPCSAKDAEVTLVSRLVPDTRRVIDRVEDLDALPVGSIVIDKNGNPWKKLHDGLLEGIVMVTNSEGVLNRLGPVTVIHEPMVDSDDGRTRDCPGQG